MSEIQWVDAPPPKKPTRTPDHASHLPTLRENPGRWAVVASHKTSPSRPDGVSATTYKYARALRGEGFEAECRVVDGRSLLYARWPAPEPKPTPLRPGQPVSKAVGYPCDDCDYEADTPGGLKVHRRRRHAA